MPFSLSERGPVRCNTVRALANRNSGASDFVRPGHVFPLVAKDGGVLMRSGHTEACIDLCRLAGLPPVGVLTELMNDDGSVMRGPGVAEFAGRHKLRQVSIADLIAYRQTRDKLVKRGIHTRDPFAHRLLRRGTGFSRLPGTGEWQQCRRPDGD